MYYKQFISAKNARVSIEKVLLELVGGRRNLKTEVSLWRRTKRFPSTLRQRNLKTEVSLWKCTKCFSSKLRRRNLKMQQSSVILDLCLRKTRAGIDYHIDYRDILVLEKRFVVHRFRPLHKKTKNWRFQIPPV